MARCAMIQRAGHDVRERGRPSLRRLTATPMTTAYAPTPMSSGTSHSRARCALAPRRGSPIEEKTRLSSLCRVQPARGNLIRWAASAAASPSGALRRLRGAEQKGEPRVGESTSSASGPLKELVPRSDVRTRVRVILWRNRAKVRSGPGKCLDGIRPCRVVGRCFRLVH